jgi:hypothetical protein
VLGAVAGLGSHSQTFSDAQRLPGSGSPALTCSVLADAASSLSQAASSGTRPAGSSSAVTAIIAAEPRIATTNTEWVPMDSKEAPTYSYWSPGDSAFYDAVNARQLYFSREGAQPQLLPSGRPQYFWM